MPGIYIDPASGSQITSTLGNILGGIATNMDPKTQAEAQLLKEQTIQEDLANQLKRATVTGITGIPGMLGSANADPTAGGGVAGTLAGAAVPPGPAPGTFGAGNFTAGYTPYARVLAGSYAADPGMANVATGVNLGKDITTGPGTDFPTSNAIVQAKNVPYNLSPGETRHVPGGAPAETTISGGSKYTETGETAGATADDALAAKDLEEGATAKANLGRAELIDQLYNRLDQLGSNDPAAIAADLTVSALSQKLGVNLNRFRDVAAMKDEIRTLGLGLTGTLRTTQGDPMPRGSLEAIQAMAADPNTPPEQFHRMIGVIKNIAQGQADNFDAAVKFRQDRPKLGDQAGIDYHIARGNNATAQGKVLTGLAPPPLPPDQPTAAAPAPTAAAPAPVATPPKKRWIWNPKTGRTEPQ